MESDYLISGVQAVSGDFMTKHARLRCQQRGIPPLIVDWLLHFGESVHAQGAEVYRFSKRSKKSVRKYAGRQFAATVDKHMNSYLVFKDGYVITVGHRHKPLQAN